LTGRPGSRKDEILRRAGIDPVRVDKRPLSEVLDDYIPYAKWERQAEAMRRAGYYNHQDLLENWPENEQANPRARLRRRSRKEK
jgi:hypothetical protein